MSVFIAKVKSVLSGDTVVVIPSKSAQIPPPERIITLQYVKPIDEILSKEYLRQLLIGKEVKIKVEGKAGNREFGDIKAPIFESLIEYLLTNGYVKLRDNVPDEVIDNLEQIETRAKQKQVGLWDGKSKSVDVVPLDESIVLHSQKQPLKFVVQKVISGDRVVAYIYVNDHQVSESPFLLAGVKTPRTDDPNQPAHLTKVVQQAKLFVEEKLLTTKADLTAAIIGKSQSGVPVALINHPSGNDVSQKLLELGYAEIVDWQSTLIGSTAMSRLRKAEQAAKALGKGIFASSRPTGSTGSTVSIGQGSKLKTGSTVNVSVARVVSADTLAVRVPGSDDEIVVQLASIRAPKPKDVTLTTDSAKQQAIVASAREFVRSNFIGKQFSAHVDGYREANKDLGIEERPLITIAELSESIVAKGVASVTKHGKNTEHERSYNWDKLVELEEISKKQKKGIHGDIDKFLTVSTRVVDASENHAKAKTFLNGFKSKGKVSGFHISYVPRANKVKLFSPKESLTLNFILGGIANDDSKEAVKHLHKKFFQRPVEFEVYDIDKVGSFIGNLYVSSGSLLIQKDLVAQGLIKLSDFVNTNSEAASLINAEDKAREQKKGIWKDYDETVEKEVAKTASQLQASSISTAKPEFYDVVVTHINEDGVIYFQKSSKKLEEFESQFDRFHEQNASAAKSSQDLPVGLEKAPRRGELVSAKFDGKYYRAKSLGLVKGKVEVLFIDYGNVDYVGVRELRALPTKFASIPAFAFSSVLQNLKLPPKNTDYFTAAIEYLEDLTLDKKLVASVLPGQDTSYETILYDAEESLKDATYTINKQLVSQGWAIVDAKVVNPAVKKYVEELLEVQRSAKSRHKGCWEFGDVSFEEDSLLV
ncbi:hypothetical protein CANMA_003877 [Candida margitis]|uniref:uncharacterized protein n=1 Tax=Candida margitis TaxID=1775924 RepID=UPI002227FD27|nr:uncharacterized protein CANMA_003877 [Candida margitis]KAI5961103.1 hypothetical protein CANMA_003877 [Candida margitis]